MRGGSGGNARQGIEDLSGTKLLLYINAVVFLALCLVGERRSAEWLFDYLALRGDEPMHFWRLVTYQFTHVGFSHIFWNMWSLVLFGRMVESVLGKTRFLVLYVFSGVIGGVFWLLSNHGDPHVCIGASGAVFGVMMAAAMAFPNARMQLLFPPITLRLPTLILILGALDVFAVYSSTNTSVAHFAHLGGLVGAFLFMKQLLPRWRVGKSPLQNRWWQQFKEKFSEMNRAGDQDASRNEAPRPASRLGNLDPSEVDRVLDKLANSGRSSLTPEEDALLREASQRLKGEK